MTWAESLGTELAPASLSSCPPLSEESEGYVPRRKEALQKAKGQETLIKSRIVKVSKT